MKRMNKQETSVNCFHCMSEIMEINKMEPLSIDANNAFTIKTWIL